MMTDFSNLSIEELEDISNNAKEALSNKRNEIRQEVMDQIHELAKKIDVKVILEKDDRKKVNKVAMKYKDPNNPDNNFLINKVG